MPGGVVWFAPFDVISREAPAARLGLLPFQRDHLSSRPRRFRRDVYRAHLGLRTGDDDAARRFPLMRNLPLSKEMAKNLQSFGSG